MTMPDVATRASAAMPSEDPSERPQRPLIRIGGVSKIYHNGTVALRDVDLAVAHGEFVSLLGPSGCGKSTLLRLIAGLGAVSDGTIDWPLSRYDVRGEPIRDLGFVFQDPTLMPWATVADNVYLPLKLAGIGRRAAAARIAEALAMVKLERFADAYPRELSGGMKMRVSIARALVVKPRVLLMDEPFAALDVQTRARMQSFLLDVWQASGASVLFVTHHIDEAVALADRIVVFTARPGRIKTIVPVDLPRPRDPFSPAAEALRRQLTALLEDEVDRAFAEQEALRA